MLIDWFTVIAQVVNFLILVWLLKRFLYRPILNAIDAREQTIALKLADAESKMAEAISLANVYTQKQTEFDQQRAALQSQALAQANAERQLILTEAHQAADAQSAKRLQTLETDMHQLNQLIRSQTQLQVYAIARKVLQELADQALEQRATAVFIQRLQAAAPSLAAALATAKMPVLVKSAFELPELQRLAILQAVKQSFPAANPQIRFETAPEQISGIELSVNGYKLAWSIADYLTTLENHLTTLLNKGPQHAS